MRSRTSQLKELICRLLIPALVLWLSGASVLNCCAQGVEATEASAFASEAESGLPAMTDEADAAPACSGPHCQVADEGGSVAHHLSACDMHRQAASLMLCCSPAGQVANLSRKARISQERVAARAANSRTFALNQIVSIEPVSGRLRLTDNRAAYLHHCVFLI
jgi:hypothetical protein